MNSLEYEKDFYNTNPNISSKKSNFGISSFSIKIIAIIAMTFNHVANIFAPYFPEWITLSFYCLGGITFPLFAFLMTEGYIHTSNFKRYIARLIVFAIIAQIPYSLLWGPRGNVFFSLLVGLLLIYGFDKWRKEIIYWFSGSIVVLLSYFTTDWGGIGPVMILIFYIMGQRPFNLKRMRGPVSMIVPFIYSTIPAIQRLIEFLPVHTHYHITAKPNLISQAGFHATLVGSVLYDTVGFGIATIVMALYNGQQGKKMKWLFYIYYPLHLFILWIIVSFIV